MGVAVGAVGVMAGLALPGARSAAYTATGFGLGRRLAGRAA